MFFFEKQMGTSIGSATTKALLIHVSARKQKKMEGEKNIVRNFAEKEQTEILKMHLILDKLDL